MDFGVPLVNVTRTMIPFLGVIRILVIADLINSDCHYATVKTINCWKINTITNQRIDMHKRDVKQSEPK